MLVLGIEYTGDPSLPPELVPQFAAIVTPNGQFSHCNGDNWQCELTAPSDYKIAHNLNKGSYSVNISTSDPYSEAKIVEINANYIVVRTLDKDKTLSPQEFYFTLRATNTTSTAI